MFRPVFQMLMIALLLASPCAAQEWADKMFKTRSHDFGAVARGAKAEFAFEFENIFMEDVHVSSIRATCGCTTFRIEKDTLKTYEKGTIVAHINSDKFLGNQASTAVVTIDKPRYAQVSLNVKVHVYSDVILEPDSVALGGVGRGETAERTIRVTHTGRSDWRILEVKNAFPHLAAEATEVSRQGGRVVYDLKVALDAKAPVGHLREFLSLVTNDSRAKQIPVPVEGQVLADISASPSSLFLGVLQPGQIATRQLVVRGRKPFRVESISADCKCLQAVAPKAGEAKSLYLVPVTFTAGEKTGRIAQSVRIETDSGPVTVPAYAVVDKPE